MNSLQKRPFSLEETLQAIRSFTKPLPSERAPLHQAARHILREAVLAPTDQPEFDRSAVDGFAVLRDECSTVCQVVDHIRAGEWKPRMLARGQAVQISTGAALPGVDLSVVMKEDAQVEGDRVRILPPNGEPNIRFRGEDVRAGQPLVAPGARLSAGVMALLASIGKVEVSVTRRIRVLHVATGNEIVDPSQVPAPGQIRDSNSILVREFLRDWDVQLCQTKAGEEIWEIRSVLHSSSLSPQETDLLLISGGASVGEHDFSARLLEELGYEIRIERTNCRPGKPLVVGTRDTSIAFALPGNPLAHFVCLNLYVRAALECLEAARERAAFVSGYLAEPLNCGASSRRTLWPSRWSMSDVGARVSLLPWKSSGDLTCLAEANALASIPEGMERLSPGCALEFLPLNCHE